MIALCSDHHASVRSNRRAFIPLLAIRARARGSNPGLDHLVLAITDADRGPISSNPALEGRARAPDARDRRASAYGLSGARHRIGRPRHICSDVRGLGWVVAVVYRYPVLADVHPIGRRHLEGCDRPAPETGLLVWLGGAAAVAVLPRLAPSPTEPQRQSNVP